jgi:hypothetical protein
MPIQGPRPPSRVNRARLEPGETDADVDVGAPRPRLSIRVKRARLEPGETDADVDVGPHWAGGVPRVSGRGSFRF